MAADLTFAASPHQKLVSSLSPTDYAINVGVLQTAHSIFQYWRSATRSDALFSVINYVLSRFTKPFLQLFDHTAQLLLTNAPGDASSTIELRAQAQVLLIDLFYDLVCQDLPPDFEDGHGKWFGPEDGLFMKFLTWDPVELRGDVRVDDVLSVLAAECPSSPMILQRPCRPKLRPGSSKLPR